MTSKLVFLLVCWGTFFQVAARSTPVRLEPDTMTLVDTARGRAIPLAIYSKKGAPLTDLRLVILSHGYNDNLPGTYLHYSHLAGSLAEHGCYVVSVQHELRGDEPLAMKGDLRTLRRPTWERGVRNILFVLNELERIHPEFGNRRITLIGHSNGGDISVLFAQEYPGSVENLITLDNRRLPLPRTREPRVLSLRSSDAPADSGVLPTPEEQALHHIRILPLPDVKHNEMSDRGTDRQRKEIAGAILDFLNEH